MAKTFNFNVKDVGDGTWYCPICGQYVIGEHSCYASGGTVINITGAPVYEDQDMEEILRKIDEINAKLDSILEKIKP